METFASTEVTTLAKTLIDVQRLLQPVPRDSENPFTKSTYASLRSVVTACRDALLNNGIWLCQYLVPIETPGCIGVMTKLTHAESGQWQASLATVPLPKADPQGMGSAITYARRYALTAMLGMVTEDDDGESAKAVPHNLHNRTASQRRNDNDDFTQMPAVTKEDPLSRLPQLDGVMYQLMVGNDGCEYIIATGKTRPKKDVLSGMGFRWNAQRGYWWKTADAA